MGKNILITFLVIFGAVSSYAQEDNKNLTPPDGKAVVYFIRSSGYGFAAKVEVGVDKIPVGTTKGNTYLYTIVDPGEHVFYSQSEKRDEKTLLIEAGKTYYFYMKVYPGAWKIRCELEQIFEDRAIPGLAECKPGKYSNKK
jgi:hypothetical protein